MHPIGAPLWPQRRALPTRDDLWINSWTWSQGSPPNCLLLHGFAHTGRVWANFAKRAPAQLQVAALDLPGHGDSAWDPQTDYSIAGITDQVELALQALKIEHFVLAGHSLGGAVALHLATRRPGMLRGLCLLDFGPELRSAGLRAIRNGELSSPRTYPSVQAYARSLIDRYPLVDAKILNELAAHGLRNTAGQLERALDPAFMRGRDAVRSETTWDELENLTCPLLVLRGAVSSVLTRDVAERMAQTAPCAELVEVPHCGHALHLENPDAVYHALTDFFARAAPGCPPVHI